MTVVEFCPRMAHQAMNTSLWRREEKRLFRSRHVKLFVKIHNLNMENRKIVLPTCSVWRHTRYYSIPCPSLCSPQLGLCSRLERKCLGWRRQPRLVRELHSPQPPSEGQIKTQRSLHHGHLSAREWQKGNSTAVASFPAFRRLQQTLSEDALC